MVLLVVLVLNVLLVIGGETKSTPSPKTEVLPFGLEFDDRMFHILFRKDKNLQSGLIEHLSWILFVVFKSCCVIV